MSPFFVIVGAFLLAVWWFLPTRSSSSSLNMGTAVVGVDFENDFGAGMEKYVVREGDTCWRIAEGRVEELKEVNEGLDCDRLEVGTTLCVPMGGEGG